MDIKNKKIKTKCLKHSDKDIKYINVIDPTDTSIQLILCDDCLSESEVKGKLIAIKNIISNQPIENWPYSQKNPEKQKEINQQKEIISTLQQEIMNQFTSFKNQIISIIDEYQKSVISYLQNLSEELTIISDSFSQNEYKSQISNLLFNSKQDVLEAELRNILSLMKSNYANQEKQNDSQSRLNSINKVSDNIINTQNDILDYTTKSLENSIQGIHSLLFNSSSVMDQLDIQPSQFNNSQSSILIKKNQEGISIVIDSSFFRQAVSKYQFEKDKKYLIHIQIESKSVNNGHPLIGLIRSDKIHSTHLYKENLCFYISPYGLHKIIKGENVYNTYPREIVLFISIDENKMYAADYPSYQNVNTLPDNNNNLINYKNLCLAFSSGSLVYLKYNIKECKIINEDPDWIK